MDHNLLTKVDDLAAARCVRVTLRVLYFYALWLYISVIMIDDQKIIDIRIIYLVRS